MKKVFMAVFLLTTGLLTAQKYVLDSIAPLYGHLIKREANYLKFADESPYFNYFFSQMDSVFEGKNRKIHIFHIGGSHIQADVYSNKVRTYLQNTNEVSTAQRGFIFPYQLAKTNNPSNYRITANRDLWTGYRSSVTKDSIAWGLSGVTAAFRQIADTVYIKANHKTDIKNPYHFDKLRIFYNTWQDDYHINIMDSSLVVSDSINYETFYREFHFNTALESIAVTLHKKDTINDKAEFLLMGIELMNSTPGIEYTSIGVNGGSFAFYNRSAFFEKQLQLYRPDMFIISIGTNDGYMPKSEFKEDVFEAYYESFIQMILRINPQCAILLTVPNDVYYKKKYANSNTRRQQEVIYRLAQKYQMAVWDFYEIMDGLGSSNQWYRNKLMLSDRIHFTNLGYQIKGDLLLEALIDGWAKSVGRDKELLLQHYKGLNE